MRSRRIDRATSGFIVVLNPLTFALRGTGTRFERRQSISAAPLTQCPECSGHVHRCVQPVGVVFKGSGFYVTDNKSSSSTRISKKESSKASKGKSSSLT
ncbi:MAG: FmdB family zinc ribbon protein [Anaerolineae bacterium]